eukprot:2570218-Heterocapsa_arctica.AAC.1
MHVNPLMTKESNIRDFTDSGVQYIVISSPYYYDYYYSNNDDDYYYSNNDDDYDDEDNDANDIRWSTGMESTPGTTSWKLKGGEVKFTDNADIREKRVARIIERSCRQQARAKERASSHRVELNALRGQPALAVSKRGSWTSRRPAG